MNGKSDTLEVHDVAQPFSRPEIRAAIIDFPKGNVQVEGRALEVVGWVVGSSSRVTAVELSEGPAWRVRQPTRSGREDVARQYADSPQGPDVSFLLNSPPLAAGPHELSLTAVLEDGDTAPLGTIQLTAVLRARPAALILLYHRIVDLASEPWSLSVTPRHFQEQMSALAAIAQPIRLRRLVEALRKGGALPERRVVVTFDDGYADNYHTAVPVLERHGVPATVFLTTGFVGQPYEMWWDALDRVLLEPGVLPPVLPLRVDGQVHEWDLGEDAAYPAERAASFRSWRAGAPPPTRRHAVYRAAWDLLSTLDAPARAAAVDQLQTWSGIGGGARRTHRSLTQAELAELARSPAVEIGAHTITHSALSELPREAQRLEIEESKRQLEAQLATPVTGLAYPFGTRAHYTDETVELVRRSGLQSACTNVPAAVERDSDPYQLPRVIVPDVDGDRFAALLRKWLDDS